MIYINCQIDHLQIYPNHRGTRKSLFCFMKPFAEKFYKSTNWQTCREAYARSVKYLCEDCLGNGLIVPGEIVHHVTEITPENIDDPEITMNFNNLRMVCRDCHAKHHGAKQGQRYTILSDGTVIPKREKNR